MVKVEHGSFIMGGRYLVLDDAKPHKVTITKGYWIGETEVTQKLFLAVMGDFQHHFGMSIKDYWSYVSQSGDYLPAFDLSYPETMEFIKKLNEVTGKAFRLPTEAEWEFAAIGGNKSMGYLFSGSDDPVDVSWFSSVKPAMSLHSVGGKRPNELGLYDMTGNVQEWCSDWYAPYGSEDQVDPAGPDSGTDKVYRGCEYQSVDYNDFLVFIRKHCPYDYLNAGWNCGGLRLVLPVD